MNIKFWVIFGIGIFIAAAIMITYETAHKDYRFASVLNEQTATIISSDLYINSGVKIIKTVATEQIQTLPLTWLINTAFAKENEETKPKKNPIKKKSKKTSSAETDTTTEETGTSTNIEIKEKEKELEPFKIFEPVEWIEFRDNGKSVVKGDTLAYKILLQNNAITPAENFTLETDIPSGTDLIQDSVEVESKKDYPYTIENNKIIININTLPKNKFLIVTYKVNISAENGVITHAARVKKDSTIIAATTPLSNPLPETAPTPQTELCFSKQFRKDLINKTRGNENLTKTEEQLRWILLSNTDAVDFYLNNRTEESVYENFVNSIVAIPCISVPAGFPLPDNTNQQITNSPTEQTGNSQPATDTGTTTTDTGTTTTDTGTTTTDTGTTTTDTGTTTTDTGTTTTDTRTTTTDTGTTTTDTGTTTDASVIPDSIQPTAEQPQPEPDSTIQPSQETPTTETQTKINPPTQ